MEKELTAFRSLNCSSYLHKCTKLSDHDLAGEVKLECLIFSVAIALQEQFRLCPYGGCHIVAAKEPEGRGKNCDSVFHVSL